MLQYLMLQNAPTQSLLGVVNGILEETVEKRNGEMPYVCMALTDFWFVLHIVHFVHSLIFMFVIQRVACLLRKVSQELERRMSAQAEHSRTVCQIHLLLL